MSWECDDMCTVSNFCHSPVLLNETIELLDIKKNGIYVDATAGGGGHSQAILDKLDKGRLIAIDQDPDAIKQLRSKFKDKQNVNILQGNFSNMKKLLSEINIFEIDGVLMDIGVSSYQLDEADRGFSYHKNAKLDMRMSRQGVSACDIINTYKEDEIARILFEYAEEKFARQIARQIVRQRDISRITSTNELSEIVKQAYPAKFRKDAHPARKTFQALRIEVNNELEVLKKGFDEAFDLLKPSARLAVITFHSLEDRIVKERMKKLATGCTCPSQFPVCVCGKKAKAKLVNRKAIQATKEELIKNKRSRSAKLRVCEKI